MSRSVLALTVAWGLVSSSALARDEVSVTVESVLRSIANSGVGRGGDAIGEVVSSVELERSSKGRSSLAPANAASAAPGRSDDTAERDIREVVAILEGKSRAKAESRFNEIFGGSKSKSVPQPVVDLDVADVAPLTKPKAGNKPQSQLAARTKPPVYTFGPTRAGATLETVAAQLLPSSSVTVSQMMWALYVKNPGAFANNNPASLKPSSVLNVPEPDEVAAISRTNADLQLSRLRAAAKPAKASSAL